MDNVFAFTIYTLFSELPRLSYITPKPNTCASPGLEGLHHVPRWTDDDEERLVRGVHDLFEVIRVELERGGEAVVELLHGA